MKIRLINGPNLQLLGTRKPEIYGSTTLPQLEQQLVEYAKDLNVELTCFQSNTEGAIVDNIANAKAQNVDGIIINPGAYTHTSIAIRDAIEAVEIPAIEVHISNIHARESFRHTSMTAPVCIGQIVGLGVDGYTWALGALVQKLLSNTNQSDITSTKKDKRKTKNQ